ILYCIPADLSLSGQLTRGFLVVGEEKVAYVEDGEVREVRDIAEASEYKVVPLIGNAILEARGENGHAFIARTTMHHAARLGYIAQVLNDLSARRKVRIFNNEDEPTCLKCGGQLVHGTRICPKCMNKTEAFKRLFVVAKNYKRP